MRFILLLLLFLPATSLAGCSALPFGGEGLKGAAKAVYKRNERKEQRNPSVKFEAETDSCRCEMQSACN